MSKRKLSFAGILVAFVFLLAINTNVFSFKFSTEECYGCYDEEWTSGGLCTVGDKDPEHIRVCFEMPEAEQCNTMYMYGSCRQDKDHCSLIGGDEEGLFIFGDLDFEDPPTGIKCKGDAYY